MRLLRGAQSRPNPCRQLFIVRKDDGQEIVVRHQMRSLAPRDHHGRWRNPSGVDRPRIPRDSACVGVDVRLHVGAGYREVSREL